MKSIRVLKSILAVAAAAVLLGAECMDEASPPPRRAVMPTGSIERGPFYAVSMYNGKDYLPRELDSASITISPMDGVVYDAATGKFQFRELGKFLVTVNGQDSELSTVLTVVDAPTIVFDLSVNGNRDIYSQTIYGFNFTRLSTDAADDISPTGRKLRVIFTSYHDGNGELYRKMLNDAEPPLRLTFTTANETEAQLSPDGEKLAYVRDDGGVRRVWVSNADGSSAAPLTTSPATAQEGHPRWYLTSDYLLITSTVGGGTAIYRCAATPGSKPTPFATPLTADSVYDDPDVRGLRSTNFAAGGAHWIASAPGGPRRARMGSVIYNGSGAEGVYTATPASVSVGEPYNITGASTTVFTRFMPDGSTTLGWIAMTAPFQSFDAIWKPIPVPGLNPRRASEIRP